jgi:hypothetical protein
MRPVVLHLRTVGSTEACALAGERDAGKWTACVLEAGNLSALEALVRVVARRLPGIFLALVGAMHVTSLGLPHSISGARACICASRLRHYNGH